MMSINRFELLRRQTAAEFPRFNIRQRRKSWLRPIFWMLEKVTGRVYSSFTTTIGSTMYVGDNWDQKSTNSKYSTLRHEKKHIEQLHRWPLGRWAWPVNHVLFSICYLLVLPVLWTFRARFEREAYTETLLVQYELSGRISDERMEENAAWLAKIFGGSAYLFMWRRRRAYEWAMETQRKINAGEIRNPKDQVQELRAA
jgi:hypothetical protein